MYSIHVYNVILKGLIFKLWNIDAKKKEKHITMYVTVAFSRIIYGVHRIIKKRDSFIKY